MLDFKYNLQVFADPNTNTTLSSGLSDEMKTYYSDYLIDNATPELVHDQFGQKHPIPKNGGKTIEFRKFIPLGKALTPIKEGVTPDGQSLSVTKIEATVDQYGNYVTLSDIIQLTAIDNTLVETTKLLGAQAGMTLDTITREVLNGGTSVIYAGGKPARRTLKEDCKLTVEDIYKAARFLKAQNAPKIEGGYVAIIHPDVAYDLMRDPEWVDVHKYSATTEIFEGEIGKIAGVRFVETTEAKIFHAEDLASNIRTLTINSFWNDGTDTSATYGSPCRFKITYNETISDEDAAAMVGRRIHIQNKNATTGSEDIYPVVVGGMTPSTKTMFFVESSVTIPMAFVPESGDTIYPDGAGAYGRDIYSTLVLGANAYGVTELEGGGLQHIVKQLGSGGTSDPLNQRGTAGWKATKVAERLVESYMVRIESASTFESGAN